MSQTREPDRAPYDPRGNLKEYVWDHLIDQCEWRENSPFQALMILEDTERGRSAARFIWRDYDGHRFPMFMTDMLDLIQQRTVSEGSVSTWWKIAKRGKNYGLRLATDEEIRALGHRSGLAQDCPACYLNSEGVDHDWHHATPTSGLTCRRCDTAHKHWIDTDCRLCPGQEEAK